MAEDAQPPPRQNNHRERLGLKLNGRSLEVSAGQLLPILLLIGVIVGVYLIFVSIDHRVTTILDRQERGLALFEKTTSAWITQLADQRAFLVEQIEQARQHVNAQTDIIRRMLAIHEANQDRTPETRLPLEYPGEPPPPPRSGR